MMSRSVQTEKSQGLGRLPGWITVLQRIRMYLDRRGEDGPRLF